MDTPDTTISEATLVKFILRRSITSIVGPAIAVATVLLGVLGAPAALAEPLPGYCVGFDERPVGSGEVCTP